MSVITSQEIPNLLSRSLLIVMTFPWLFTYLDDRLRVLEETPITPTQFPYQAYAEAKVFLKVCYIFSLIVLDDIAGIIEYFYKKNEPNVEVKKRFSDLLGKANKDRLSSSEPLRTTKGSKFMVSRNDEEKG